jgi:thymidylate kinase
MAFIIGVCGVDGTGKTTVSRLVIQRLEKRGIRAHYHHELDFPVVKFLIRRFGFLMGKGRTEGLKQQVLAGKEKNRSLVSLFYHAMVWFDSMAAFITFKFRRGVVVHDRWPFDFLLQFKSRQYNNRLIWFLFQHFPRPDALILLKVSPEAAYQRKLTDPGHVDSKLEFYETQNRYMDEIEKIYRYDKVISTEDLAADLAASEILDFVENRLPVGS